VSVAEAEKARNNYCALPSVPRGRSFPDEETVVGGIYTRGENVFVSSSPLAQALSVL